MRQYYADTADVKGKKVCIIKELLENNIKTYNFTRWLIEAVKELSQVVYIVDDYSNEINADEYLSKIKTLLNVGKTLYFTRYSYEGDAEEYGHIYVHDVRNKSISKRLIEAKAITDVL